MFEILSVIALATVDWGADTLQFLNDTLIIIKRCIALLGSTIILFGALYAISRFFYRVLHRPTHDSIFNFDLIRLDLVKTIILGLEFIIAADVIETVTAPDYYSLGIVAVVVLIRTFLNYSLSKDLLSIHRPNEKL